MSEEWDSVTKIGKSVRPGGAARPTVARTQAEINAARRAGAVVGTEKKV
jgi:putative transcription factor